MRTDVCTGRLKMQDVEMQKNVGHENRWPETVIADLALRLPFASLQRCNLV